MQLLWLSAGLSPLGRLAAICIRVPLTFRVPACPEILRCSRSGRGVGEATDSERQGASARLQRPGARPGRGAVHRDVGRVPQLPDRAGAGGGEHRQAAVGAAGPGRVRQRVAVGVDRRADGWLVGAPEGRAGVGAQHAAGSAGHGAGVHGLSDQPVVCVGDALPGAVRGGAGAGVPGLEHHPASGGLRGHPERRPLDDAEKLRLFAAATRGWRRRAPRATRGW